MLNPRRLLVRLEEAKGYPKPQRMLADHGQRREDATEIGNGKLAIRNFPGNFL